MPRYFFHLYNDIEARDEEGSILPDSEAARKKAIAEARNMMAVELQEKGAINLSHWIEVEDELGETVAIVKFGDAVKINP
jgi:hypothetical protein